MGFCGDDYDNNTPAKRAGFAPMWEGPAVVTNIKLEPQKEVLVENKLRLLICYKIALIREVEAPNGGRLFPMGKDQQLSGLNLCEASIKKFTAFPGSGKATKVAVHEGKLTIKHFLFLQLSFL